MNSVVPSPVPQRLQLDRQAASSSEAVDRPDGRQHRRAGPVGRQVQYGHPRQPFFPERELARLLLLLGSSFPCGVVGVLNRQRW